MVAKLELLEGQRVKAWLEIDPFFEFFVPFTLFSNNPFLGFHLMGKKPFFANYRKMDEIIWKTIQFQFCSFKVKTDKNQNFCRNEFNLTGLCSKQSCPLANSQYATVKRVQGTLFLYVKTIERSHQPSKLWQKIKLHKNFERALQQVWFPCYL